MNIFLKPNCQRNKQNVIGYLKASEIFGECCKTLHQMPIKLCLGQLYEFEDHHVDTLLTLVHKLDEASVQWNPSKTVLLEIFWWLKQKIVKPERLTVESDAEESEESDYTPLKWIKLFVNFGGVKALLRFLMAFSLLPSQIAKKQETRAYLELKGVALEIFHGICVEFEKVAQNFAKQDDLLHCLFSLMQYEETCIPACRVVECLLLSRRGTLDLSSIKNLPELVSGFDDIQLANFCKILAITLSELDMYENKSSLYAQTKQKKSQNFYVRDVNQDVVLNIPKIMSRLVQIACAKPYIPCFPYVVTESDQWMQWIDNQLMDEIRNTHEGNPSPFISGISQWSDSNLNIGPQTAVRISLELSFRADAVCVLGLLLVGRHRREVQKELAELQLIPQLSELFDHFVWRWSLGRDHTRLPGHNSSCECSPEVALKIQVLRLIHSFCDHSDYKHVMLSWSEYSELRQLEESTENPSPVPSWLDRSVMCVGSRGLLTKIVEVMKRETSGSTFRFWLSRAIESYLRGSASSADQDFLIRRGLLQHVIGNLVNSSVRQKEVLQSSFDLLGELIKFNINAFHQLDKGLNTKAKQKKLSSLMNSSLVDSNMFIRSLILSQEFFMSSNDEDTKCYAAKQCYLLSDVCDLRQRVRFLHKLVSLITVHNLTQENVSCLNTALVILMFGNRKEELPQYLQHLYTNQDSCSLAVSNQPGLLHNLRDLLLFWQDHYLQKDKDCTVLEKSSRICFQEWRDIVGLLTSEDSQNQCSLLCHMSPTTIFRAY